jgi:hypothetical protein
LNLTSTTDTSGNIHAGVFNIESNRFVLDADLTNDRTNDTTKSNYGYGLIAMNSDGHLTINGNGDNDNTASIEAGQNEVITTVTMLQLQPVTTKFVSTTLLVLVLSLTTTATS